MPPFFLSLSIKSGGITSTSSRSSFRAVMVSPMDGSKFHPNTTTLSHPPIRLSRWACAFFRVVAPVSLLGESASTSVLRSPRC